MKPYLPEILPGIMSTTTANLMRSTEHRSPVTCDNRRAAVSDIRESRPTLHGGHLGRRLIPDLLQAEYEPDEYRVPTQMSSHADAGGILL